MVNTHGGVIGFIFGGQNMECYQTIIGYVVQVSQTQARR
jgi:hypothetical protein